MKPHIPVFVVLGSSALTRICMEEIIRAGFQVAGLVATPSRQRQLDSVNLKGFCHRRDIPYREWQNLNSAQGNRLLLSCRPDYILSTWPYLLSAKTLEIPSKMVIGSHPTALPRNRGRHPLYWLLCLGISGSKMSFFQMDARVDHGPILSQTRFRVHLNRPLAATVDSMNAAARKGIRRVLGKIRSGRPQGRVQNHTQANFWRKRTIHDVLLDPRMDHQLVLRTVRSFAPPCPGAVLVLENRIFRVLSARALPTPPGFSRMEFGRVLSINGRRIKLKMGNGLVELTLNQALPPALRRTKHLHPPTYYLGRDFKG